MTERIERIKRVEEIFDRLQTEPDEARLGELRAYYESPLWLSDYEADERGLLPMDLKRGVLSQDGVYDFLTECQL
jgi:hypothetical protein